MRVYSILVLIKKCSVTVIKLIHERTQLCKILASLSSLPHSTQLTPMLLKLVYTCLTSNFWFQIPVFISAFDLLWIWQFLNFPFCFFFFFL